MKAAPTKSHDDQKEFTDIANEHVLTEDEYFWVVPDRFPVSPGHTLIILKSSRSRYHQLSSFEKLALLKLIDWTVDYLENSLVPKPDGFNFGLNDGPAAGQTKKQFHFHIIPRYHGDCEDPRGGIRYVLPEKAKYWN